MVVLVLVLVVVVVVVVVDTGGTVEVVEDGVGFLDGMEGGGGPRFFLAYGFLMTTLGCSMVRWNREKNN